MSDNTIASRTRARSAEYNSSAPVAHVSSSSTHSTQMALPTTSAICAAGNLIGVPPQPPSDNNIQHMLEQLTTINQRSTLHNTASIAETPTKKICWDEEMQIENSPFHDQGRRSALTVVEWAPPPETAQFISSVEPYQGVNPPTQVIMTRCDYLSVAPLQSQLDDMTIASIQDVFTQYDQKFHEVSIWAQKETEYSRSMETNHLKKMDFICSQLETCWQRHSEELLSIEKIVC